MAENLEERIKDIVEKNRNDLAEKVLERKTELLDDDDSHQEIYRVLGVPAEECAEIDLYQNVGRFVYTYAGTMMEDVTRVLIESKDGGGPKSIPNTVSQNPANFEIDSVTPDGRAHEIKWRDATTDGDHIRKEANKVESILASDLTPVRVMYFMPVRSAAHRIQLKVIEEFERVGEAYVGEKAWDYVEERSGVDLKALLSTLAGPHPDW